MQTNLKLFNIVDVSKITFKQLSFDSSIVRINNKDALTIANIDDTFNAANISEAGVSKIALDVYSQPRATLR